VADSNNIFNSKVIFYALINMEFLASPLKIMIKNAFNLFGWEIVRKSKTPRFTLLGLKNFPIRTIIDIGANEGQFAKMISTFFPAANIFCFEPLDEPFNKLREWAGRQKGQVRALNIALGDKEGEAEIFFHQEHTPSSSFLKSTEKSKMLYPFTRSQTTEKVKVSTLDKMVSFFADKLIPEILIKIDVQGYEDRVLKGGLNTLRMARACLLEINLDYLYEQQATFKDILLLFAELGYQYAGNFNQTLANDGRCVYIDALFLK